MRTAATGTGGARDRVHDSFRRSLGSYHASAAVQARIAGRLAELLAQAGAPDRFARALEFGAGTGHLTDALLSRFAIDDLTLNDLVAECLPHLAPLVAARVASWSFLAGAIETAPLAGRFDLVASASTVQWVADPQALLARLAGLLRPGGWLALSGFGPGQFAELAALGSTASAPHYATAAEWAARLPAGLRLIAAHEEEERLWFADLHALLRHLRRTGVNGNATGAWTRSQLAAVERTYRQLYSEAGKLRLTYAPVYLLLRKEV